MSKRTQKAGITGKFGTRYGASLRKIVKKFQIQQHSRYLCPFCGKTAVRRQAVGVWRCNACKKTMAGGAWELQTSPAQVAKSTLLRIRKLREDIQE